MTWPDHIDVPFEDFLDSLGTIVRQFGERQDSRTTILGLEAEDGRFVVKHAEDPAAVRLLESALRFHAAVAHPTIVPVIHSLTTSTGRANVMPWAEGVVLHDPYDPAVPLRDEPGSPYRRFLGLSADEIASTVGKMIDAHVAVAAAGFVAVDLYDGCLVYDFEGQRMSLIDLDMYRPGPFTLQRDRLPGSTTFMAPEEWQRGAEISERTNVFTLGRFALVLLGCARAEPPSRSDFRGTDAQFEVATCATAPDPADRFPSLATLAEAWSAACG
jgi:serine/threonine protein kinase